MDLKTLIIILAVLAIAAVAIIYFMFSTTPQGAKPILTTTTSTFYPTTSVSGVPLFNSTSNNGSLPPRPPL